MRKESAVVLAVICTPLVLKAQSVTDDVLCSQLVRGGTPAAQARETAKGIVAARTGSASAAFLTGCTAFADGKFDRAAEHFEAAVKLEQKSHYYDWLGRAYGDQAQKANKLKQPLLARKTKNAFEKAVALDADNLDARSYLASFYQMAPGVMGGSDDKAREQIAAIKARNSYRGALAMAQFHVRDQQSAAAEREYQSLIASHPDSVAGYNGVIQIQVNARRWNEAFTTADAMRTRAALQRLGDYAVGRIAALSGSQLDRGEASMRRYLTAPSAPNEPTHANAHFRLAQILQHRKDTAGARASYQETLRLQPDHQEAKKALAALK